MKFTINWLRDFLDFSDDVQTLCNTLNRIGLEVESVHNPAQALNGVTIAYIEHASPHPDADKLQICRVLAHDGSRQIVCGAPNARAGLYVAMADIGCIIPANGLMIKASKIRGIESNGMLCSIAELELGGDSAGIMELEATHNVIGTPLAQHIGLDDVVIEIAITPNRGDALGVYGIARDLAAAGFGTLKSLHAPDIKETFSSNLHVSTTYPDACPYIALRELRGLHNGASPTWLTQRLKAVGLRSISAIVDVTNYIMWSFNRPLHAFDKNALSGEFMVTKATPETTFYALNDTCYTLHGGELVITDAKDGSVQAMAGVMGASTSACTMQTTDIYLESALFSAEAVMHSARMHHILSDSRYRFERNIDADMVDAGLAFATQLLLDVCGGEAGSIVCAGSLPPAAEVVEFCVADITRISGIELDAEYVYTILNAIGCTCQEQGSTILVTPPSWRHDIRIREDLVEEILRLHGYDNIPLIPLPPVKSAPDVACYSAQQRTRRALATQGLQECVHFAFIRKDDATLFHSDSDNPLVEVVNPISSDLSVMRPSLLPALIRAAVSAQARGFCDSKLFEIGYIFQGVTPSQQPMHLAILRTGKTTLHWMEPQKAVTIYDVKADLETALEQYGFRGKLKYDTSNLPSWAHPGASAHLMLGKVKVGILATLHPATLRHMDTKQDIFVCELILSALPQPRKAKPTAVQLSDYQLVERDFAFLVARDIEMEQLVQAILATEKKLIRNICIFDVYQGERVQENQQSVALRVSIQADDRTLSDAEIQSISQRITQAAGKLGAVLRS